MKTLLVVGSGSRIGRELAVLAARAGWIVLVTRREPDESARDAEDVSIRSGSPTVHPLTLRLESPETFAEFVRRDLSGHDLCGVFVTAGSMPPESELASSPELFAKMAGVNYAGVASLLDQVLPTLPSNAGAFISCLTSVAGDRGRASNFRYGSTKAALSTFLEGLSVHAVSRGVLVQDVKLGPVDTPLNSEVTRMPFAIRPNFAAQVIWNHVTSRTPRVYVPAKWRWIMLVIRLIPRSLYNRLPL